MTTCIANPNAAKYAAMAKTAASRGPKRFIYTTAGDDMAPFPNHKAKKAYRDNPFRETWGWIRCRWMWHDFRLFGLKDTLRRQYYMTESFRRRGERHFAGKDEHGNIYWTSKNNGSKWNGRLFEPKDPHWFRGQDYVEVPPPFLLWMGNSLSFNPAQLKARGEHGLATHSRVRTSPFNFEHQRFSVMSWGHVNEFDPWMTSHAGSIMHPNYQDTKESGFAYGKGSSGTPNPNFPTFMGEFDTDHDTVRRFFRTRLWNARASHGIDSDEWRMGH